MIPTQRLPVSLTPLDVALALLLEPLNPVAPVGVPLAEALGCIAAEMPALAAAPVGDTAGVDGWALRARDLAGASSYAPLPLTRAPAWVEAGDRLPDGCDCVIDADLVDQSGAIIQVLAEAIPGQGVRRGGSDIAEASRLIRSGQPVRPLDLLLARVAGLQTLQVRRPRLRLVNIPAAGSGATARLIAESAAAAGAGVACSEAAGRDAAAIAGALEGGACDLLLTIGGTGVGRTDATVAALGRRGTIIAHGIALQPGRTTAVGRIGQVPLVALPGAADQALAAWWTLALPALDRLSGRTPRPTHRLPLLRKVASSVGIAEIVVLEQGRNGWLPLAVGELSLQAIARADAWLVMAGGSEGFAAGASVDAYMLRDRPMSS